MPTSTRHIEEPFAASIFCLVLTTKGNDVDEAPVPMAVCDQNTVDRCILSVNTVRGDSRVNLQLHLMRVRKINIAD